MPTPPLSFKITTYIPLRKFVYIIVLLNFTAEVYAQSTGSKKGILKLIDSASIAYCKGDTDQFISILAPADKLYPTDASIIFINAALAEMYVANGDINNAKQKLQNGLIKRPTSYSLFRDSVYCHHLFGDLDFFWKRAGLCVSLSRIYLAEKQMDSALHFLQLADNEFLPYTDCANGMIMYKSYLSPFFADYYLIAGDTAKAINRLLDFFLKRDGERELLTIKLKTILLQQYTQEQIKQEVDKALRTMRFKRTTAKDYIPELKLFEHIVTQYFGYASKKEIRQSIKQDPILMMLRN